MPNFHHHPDGKVFIRPDQGEAYVATLEEFATDLGQPYPGLPAGARERYYKPGVCHYFSDGANAVPQPLAWTEGDAYLAAYASLMAAKAIRNAQANLEAVGP